MTETEAINTNDISRTVLLCAGVRAHFSGFGEYDMEEDYTPEEEAGGFESVEEYHAYLMTDCEVVSIEVDEEANGKTYAQGGRTIYRLTKMDGDVVRAAHWTEELEDDSPVLATRREYAGLADR